ncbi:MAG: ATP-binding protein, partial [Anaerolineae bacterium]|nr:ATP-binding protein [Anaerolineae bacterium]
MSSQLGGRLRAARNARFVGRVAEKDLFQTALSASELPFYILYIFGPGGVGKTALLGQLMSLSQEMAVPSYYLDVRSIDPDPLAFLDALCRVLGIGQQDSFSQHLAKMPRCVLFIDTYETLAPLDTWMRENFLPELPENTLIVMAGRNALSPGWRADPGWQMLTRSISLRNLEPSDARDYLARRAVPPNQHSPILDFTHGHPLALSLVADVHSQRDDVEFQPESVPDVVKTLLAQFVQKVPGPAHRAALEVCPLVRITTESLLADMLDMPDAHELFEWLSGLSFIEGGQEGIFPHDL